MVRYGKANLSGEEIMRFIWHSGPYFVKETVAHYDELNSLFISLQFLLCITESIIYRRYLYEKFCVIFINSIV